MLNRKILFTLAAAIAAVGISIAPAAAKVKGDGSHHGGAKHAKHGKHASLHPKKHHPKKHHPKEHHPKHHPKHDKLAHHHHKHHKHHHWHHKNYYPDTETTYEYESSPTYTYSEPSYTYSKPTYAYSKPADNCNCLTKEYTEDGSVVFKDTCTKELAISEYSAKNAEAED